MPVTHSLHTRVAHALHSRWQATLKAKGLNEILNRLESICCKHTERETLEACATAWGLVFAQEGAPALLDAARRSYDRMCGKLQMSLKSVATPLLNAKGGLPGLAELNIALLRFACLARLQPQQVGGLRGIATKLLDAAAPPKGKAALGAMEVRTSCMQSVFELQTVQLIFAGKGVTDAEREGDEPSMKELFKLRD